MLQGTVSMRTIARRGHAGDMGTDKLLIYLLSIPKVESSNQRIHTMIPCVTFFKYKMTSHMFYSCHNYNNKYLKKTDHLCCFFFLSLFFLLTQLIKQIIQNEPIFYPNLINLTRPGMFAKFVFLQMCVLSSQQVWQILFISMNSSITHLIWLSHNPTHLNIWVKWVKTHLVI